MKKRVRTFLWFLKRPRYYPALYFTILRELRIRRSPLNDTREEATLWCASQSVSTETAINKVTGGYEIQRIKDKFPELFIQASRRVAECPIKMGGAGNIDLIYTLTEYLKATRAFETGVAYGWSSLAFLLSLQARPESKLYSVDLPYPQNNSDRYVGCVVPDDLKSIWKIFPHADRQVLPKALKELGSIDICHYDSDKSYEGKIWALSFLWNALRKGGILISDDINDNVAFRDFVVSNMIDPIVIDWNHKYIGLVVKS